VQRDAGVALSAGEMALGTQALMDHGALNEAALDKTAKVLDAGVVQPDLKTPLSADEERFVGSSS
jgi:hypothetical protein